MSSGGLDMAEWKSGNRQSGRNQRNGTMVAENEKNLQCAGDGRKEMSNRLKKPLFVATTGLRHAPAEGEAFAINWRASTVASLMSSSALMTKGRQSVATVQLLSRVVICPAE